MCIQTVVAWGLKLIRNGQWLWRCVGKAVASNRTDPWFYSNHWQNFICTTIFIKKAKIKKKRPGVAQSNKH